MGLRIASLSGTGAPPVRQRISLCMIVRDEEEHLERCLASVRGVVDEMVVVDTGSEDGTVAIAESFGATVVHHPWSGDFAEARNVSLDAATGEWVLILDADEEMVEAQRLRGLVRDPDAEGYFLREVSFIGAEVGVEAFANPAFRLFRNRPHYRYSGALHEQILKSLDADAMSRVRFAGVEINHYGYLASQVVDRRKVSRNIEILEEELRRRPGDAFTLFNAGMEYQRAGELEKAVDYYQRSYVALSDKNMNFASLLIRNILVALNQLERWDDALAVSAEAVQLYPDFTDLFYLQAEANAGRRDYAAAVASARRALDLGDHASVQHLTQAGMGSFHCLSVLGGYYASMGDRQDAVRALRDSVRAADGYFPPPLARLTALLLETDDPAEVEEFLLRLVPERGRGRSILVVAATFARKGQPERALALVERAREEGADAASVVLGGAECELRLGRPADAMARLDTLAPSSKAQRAAQRLRAIAAIGLCDRAAGWAAVAAMADAADSPDVAATAVALAATVGGEAAPVHDEDREEVLSQLLSIGDVLIDMGDFEAFNALTAAMYETAGRPEDVHERLGLMLYEAGFLDPAADRLLEAARADAAGPEAYIALADVCEERGLPEDAEVFLRLALDADPRNPFRYLSLARRMAARGAYREGADVLREGLGRMPHSTVLRELRQTFLLLARSQPPAPATAATG